MNRDDVLRMAREAGFEVHDRKQQARVGLDALLGIDSTAKLERFAALVAAAEREACAQACHGVVRLHLADGPSPKDQAYSIGLGASLCFDAVRARGAV